MLDMTYIQINRQHYCKDQGMFCQFLDNKSGYCIATSCRRALDILYEQELEMQAHAVSEAKDAMRELYDISLEKEVTT